jgi:cell division protein FtsI (penicillin-binding protein 3)
MALAIKGIYVQKEFQRFYPDNEIAAQVLGYVGVDDNGLGGLEQKYESQLHGVPGHMSKAMDARRHVMGSSESEPEPGQNLVLTIDENIQFLAERALDHAANASGQWHGGSAGCAHRADSGAGHPTHIQSQLLPPHHAGALEKPRGQ